MSKAKIILPIILVILLLIALYLGIMLTNHKPIPAQQHELLNQQTMSTNMVPKPVAPDTHDHMTSMPSNITNNNKPEIKIQETPYGKLITTQQTGIKDGVKYQIINTRLLPKGAMIHQVEKPKVVIRHTPYGTVVATDNAAPQGNNHWQVTESAGHQPLTQQQLQRVEHHILQQQQIMQSQIQQMLSSFPVRFQQPGPHNPNH